LELWSTRTQTVLFITHDLSEAISLSDRIVVMTHRPGTVLRIFDIPLPRPRDVFSIQGDPAFARIYDEIWASLRGEVMASLDGVSGRPSVTGAPRSVPADVTASPTISGAPERMATLAHARREVFSWINLFRVLMLLGVLTLWQVLSATGVIDKLIFSNPWGYSRGSSACLVETRLGLGRSTIRSA